MTYGDFSLPQTERVFGLTVRTVSNLFAEVPPVALDPPFQAMLANQLRLALAINTEKARSEWLIAPLLGELWRRYEDRVSVYSGVPLDVDAEAGLVGPCDFLIGRPPQLYYVTAPLMVVIEAKNEDIAGGLGQCAAAMVGAQRLNQRQRTGIETIHGCVSSGAAWKFLQLAGQTLTIDLTPYGFCQANQILAILLHVAGLTTDTSAAA